MPSAEFCIVVWSPLGFLSPVSKTQCTTSRGKFNHFLRTTAGFTTASLDDCGLHDYLLARPSTIALYPIPVRQLADLLHASFRPRLAAASLRFATLYRHQIV
jgi:hypothetical protein